MGRCDGGVGGKPGMKGETVLGLELCHGAGWDEGEIPQLLSPPRPASRWCLQLAKPTRSQSAGEPGSGGLQESPARVGRVGGKQNHKAQEGFGLRQGSDTFL